MKTVVGKEGKCVLGELKGQVVLEFPNSRMQNIKVISGEEFDVDAAIDAALGTVGSGQETVYCYQKGSGENSWISENIAEVE